MPAKRLYFTDEERREANTEACRRWRERHPDEMREASRKYRREHPEKRKQTTAKWRDEHPDERRLERMRRRARDAGVPFDLTIEDVREIGSRRCYLCGSEDDLTIAHDVPLSRGGPTVKSNLFCLCSRCNSRMATKTLSEVVSQLELLT